MGEQHPGGSLRRLLVAPHGPKGLGQGDASLGVGRIDLLLVGPEGGAGEGIEPLGGRPLLRRRLTPRSRRNGPRVGRLSRGLFFLFRLLAEEGQGLGRRLAERQGGYGCGERPFAGHDRCGSGMIFLHGGPGA
jgi:hypothetical protein